MMDSSDGCTGLQRWARPLAADRALVHRAARRLGHPASIPRAIMSRSPEALAFGSRRPFTSASLSLPPCGGLLTRSRDCSRSRVPPRFPRRRYADAPAAASFFLPALRFGTISPVTDGGRKLEAKSEVRISSLSRRLRLPMWFRLGKIKFTVCFINRPYSLKKAIYVARQLTDRKCGI